MDQQGQMFVPDTVLARTGQPVHFRSSEDVLHNVRVDPQRQEAHLQCRNAAVRQLRAHLRRAGFYNVTCDIHTTMRATVYVAIDALCGHGRRAWPLHVRERRPWQVQVVRISPAATPIEKTVDVSTPHVDVLLNDSPQTPISDTNVCADLFSLQLCVFLLGDETTRIGRIPSVFVKIRAAPIWNQLCSCMCSSPGRGVTWQRAQRG